MVDFWTQIKNHLNDSLQEGEKRRKTLIEEMQTGMQLMQTGMQLNVIQNTGERSIRGYSKNTFNTYLNLLRRAGFIDRPVRGWYGLITTIPTDLSVADAKTMAYGEMTGEFTGMARATEYETFNMRMSDAFGLMSDAFGLTAHEKKHNFFSKEEFEL